MMNEKKFTASSGFHIVIYKGAPNNMDDVKQLRQQQAGRQGDQDVPLW